MLKNFVLILSLIVAPIAYAKDAEVTKKVMDNIYKVMPNLQIDSLNKTPIKGLFELISRGKLVYITEDGKYLLKGDLLDIVNNENLTSSSKKTIRVKQLNTLKREEFLIYPAKGKTKHYMSVFTDTSCPFCTRLHKEVSALTDNGIEVRYMLYPRDYSRIGSRSPSYQTMVNVWCSKDQLQALTDATEGKPIVDKNCDTPILKHIELASEMGLTGTPMIILDDGTLVSGYRPAKAILEMFK